MLNKQEQFEDKQRIGECLRDKQVFLIGDSTLANQLYGQITAIFDIDNGYIEEDKPGVCWDFNPMSMPTFVHIDNYNLTINRAFHHIKAGPFRDFNFSVFEGDILDSLGHDGSCDHVRGRVRLWHTLQAMESQRFNRQSYQHQIGYRTVPRTMSSLADYYQGAPYVYRRASQKHESN